MLESIYSLRISSTKGMIQGKLSPSYIGPFEILQRVGEVAYVLALTPSLEEVHNVIYMFTLSKHIPTDNYEMDYSELDLQLDLSYVEQPMTILDRSMNTLKNKDIPVVLVS